MVKAIKADVSTKDVKDSVHPTPGAQCRVVSLEELPIWPNDGADMLLFKRTSRDRKEISHEPVPSLYETDLVRYSHRKQSRLMSQQKTYNTQCIVSSQERSIWPNDGHDILLFKRLSGDRCEVPYEPALSLHEADLVRYLIRFLQLKAYCSFIKSCGGSDTFRGLHLTFQLFFESLEDEGWNIKKNHHVLATFEGGLSQQLLKWTRDSAIAEGAECHRRNLWSELTMQGHPTTVSS